MISLKKFKKYINFFKDYNDKIDHAEQAILKINSDFVGIAGVASPIIDQYIYMLTDLMELTECDPDLLWWWIYERNYLIIVFIKLCDVVCLIILVKINVSCCCYQLVHLFLCQF